MRRVVWRRDPRDARRQRLAASNDLAHVVLHDSTADDDVAKPYVGVLAGDAASDADHEADPDGGEAPVHVARHVGRVVGAVLRYGEACRDDVVRADAAQDVGVAVLCSHGQRLVDAVEHGAGRGHFNVQRAYPADGVVAVLEPGGVGRVREEVIAERGLNVGYALVLRRS